MIKFIQADVSVTINSANAAKVYIVAYLFVESVTSTRSSNSLNKALLSLFLMNTSVAFC